MNTLNKVFGIDGSNGVGKTTVIKIILSLIGDTLPFKTVRFPGETIEGNLIRQLLLSKEYHFDPIAEFLLFAADNVQTFNLEIIPNLEQCNFITDRTWLSSYAFQGALGVDKALIKSISRPNSPYDTIYLLDAPFLAIYDRTKKDDRIETRDVLSLSTAHDTFRNINIDVTGCRVISIDATQTPLQVAMYIFQDMMTRVNI